MAGGGEHRGLDRVERKPVRAHEVVRGPGRDHAERHAQPPREVRHGARPSRRRRRPRCDPVAASGMRSRSAVSQPYRPPPPRARAWRARAARDRAPARGPDDAVRTEPMSDGRSASIRLRADPQPLAVFSRIDHIGIAVADLDAAIALHDATYGMPLVHRETVAEQGVEAVLLDVGENHVELLAPLGDGHAGRPLPGQARPGPAPRRLPGGRHRGGARRAARRGPAADRRDAAHRHPRLARRVPAPGGDRRGPHRARPARGRPHCRSTACRSGSQRRVGFQGGQVLSLRIAEEN